MVMSFLAVQQLLPMRWYTLVGVTVSTGAEFHMKMQINVVTTYTLRFLIYSITLLNNPGKLISLKTIPTFD